MTIYIKYMVSIRCKKFVEMELEKLNLVYEFIELGEVEIINDMSTTQMETLNTALLDVGLELIINKKEILIEKIKGVIVDMFHYLSKSTLLNFSCCLEEKLRYDYTYLANLFSENTGITIEQYIIAHKIENIKTLLSYDELNLTEISYKLNYKSVAHLSSQFKQITGQTPSFFKAINTQRRLS